VSSEFEFPKACAGFQPSISHTAPCLCKSLRFLEGLALATLSKMHLMYRDHKDNRFIWTEIAEEYRVADAKAGVMKWRETAHDLCEIILTVIGLLNSTVSNERINSVIRKRESNGRQRHFNEFSLGAELLKQFGLSAIFVRASSQFLCQ